MPSRNAIKKYAENSYYHLYNRGVEKRDIFLDSQDRGVFLSYIKEYLMPKSEVDLLNQLSNPQISYAEKNKILSLLRLNNFCGEIKLVAYSLMPNHFHFLLRQKSSGSIDKFMNSFGTRYTGFFNRKYKRIGSLYQGVYKAVLVNSDEQLVHLSRYIHRQALHISEDKIMELYPTSFLDFLGKRQSEWLDPTEVLNFFGEKNSHLSYENFVIRQNDDSIISDLILEEFEDFARRDL